MVYILDTTSYPQWPPSEGWNSITEIYRSYYDISVDHCNQSKINILIIQRTKTRKILNLDSIIRKLTFHTNHHIQSFCFELHSIKEQMQRTFCTDILIGVHGAGLTW